MSICAHLTDGHLIVLAVYEATRGVPSRSERPPAYFSPVVGSFEEQVYAARNSGAAGEERLHPHLTGPARSTQPYANRGRNRNSAPAGSAGSSEWGGANPNNFAVLLEGSSAASVFRPEEKSG